MWVMLDRVNLKALKYILPLTEFGLLIFFDSLFLLPSTITFLILIYRLKIYEDKVFVSYYHIEKKKFSFNLNGILYILILSPLIFLGANAIWKGLYDSFLGFNVNGRSSIGNYFEGKQFIDYLILFGVTCIIAPLVEEFTFRVLIYGNWLTKRLNKRITAVILASLIFAISHLDIRTFIYTFVIGIILSFVYDGLGYLSAVVLHMALNIYSFLGMIGIVIHIYISLTILVTSLSLLIIFVLMSKKNIIKIKIRL